MKKFLHIHILLAIVTIVGLSFSVISCNSSSGGDSVTNPQTLSEAGTILNTLLSLIAANNFCGTVAFNLTQTGELTITVTGPAGSAPNFAVSSLQSGSSSDDPYNRLNAHHHGSSDSDSTSDPSQDDTSEPESEPEATESSQDNSSGVRTDTYKPPTSGSYQLGVCDSNSVGGTFSILITQQVG